MTALRRSSVPDGAWLLLAAALATTRCAPLTAAGARVEVYWPPFAEASDAPAMLEGCRLVDSAGPDWIPEADLEGPGALRSERNRAGAAGGNVLVVLSRLVAPRRDFDCPAAAPISDCPHSLGAWFEVVFQSYSCSAEGVRRLRGPRPPTAPGSATLRRPGVLGKHVPCDGPVVGAQPCVGEWRSAADR